MQRSLISLEERKEDLEKKYYYDEVMARISCFCRVEEMYFHSLTRPKCEYSLEIMLSVLVSFCVWYAIDTQHGVVYPLESGEVMA